jgi:hypothetical protein
MAAVCKHALPAHKLKKDNSPSKTEDGSILQTLLTSTQAHTLAQYSGCHLQTLHNILFGKWKMTSICWSLEDDFNCFKN